MSRSRCFEGGGFNILEQLGDLTGEQRVPLSVEYGDVALGVLELARDAQKLCGAVFTDDGGVDFEVIVKKSLQSFSIATSVCLIGAGHQQGEVLLLDVIAREVRVNSFRDVTEESLETGWWIELCGIVSIAECGVMSLLGALTSTLSSAARGVGVVEVNFAFGDVRFEVVELSVEDSDLAEVTPFEGLELGTELGELRFALSERTTNSRKLLSLMEEGNGVRGLLEDDFGWHAVSHEGNSSLAERSCLFADECGSCTHRASQGVPCNSIIGPYLCGFSSASASAR